MKWRILFYYHGLELFLCFLAISLCVAVFATIIGENV